MDQGNQSAGDSSRSPWDLTLSHESGVLRVRRLDDGRFELHGEAADPNVFVPHSPCVTSYPLPLIEAILQCYGAVHACDEIGRDVDEHDAALDVEHCVQAYFSDRIFAEKVAILDYGCGAGSSTLALARLFGNARIVGVEMVGNFVEVARRRAAHYGLNNLRFETVPAGSQEFLPEYDYVFLNAVYEHLLPNERSEVLGSIWRALRPGGTLFLNQTPHRWFPVETHTSGLPLVNYLPPALALWAIRHYCGRSVRNFTWDQLLRAGVRGGTIEEIMRHIRRSDPSACLRRPVRIAKSWAGIWYATKRERMANLNGAMRVAFSATQALVSGLRLPLSPYLSLAITKSGTANHEPDSPDGRAKSHGRSY